MLYYQNLSPRSVCQLRGWIRPGLFANMGRSFLTEPCSRATILKPSRNPYTGGTRAKENKVMSTLPWKTLVRQASDLAERKYLALKINARLSDHPGCMTQYSCLVPTQKSSNAAAVQNVTVCTKRACLRKNKCHMIDCLYELYKNEISLSFHYPRMYSLDFKYYTFPKNLDKALHILKQSQKGLPWVCT